MGTTFTIVSIALSIILLVFLTVKVKLHPFFALSICAFFFGLLMQQPVSILEAYSNVLGSTIAGIGIVIVIAIGTVMGELLERSGAAETMADTILKITGKHFADVVLAITGYFVSIPVRRNSYSIIYRSNYCLSCISFCLS